MFNTDDLIWTDFSPASKIPRTVSDWLDDGQSLTAKLKQKFADFRVQVLSQKVKKPDANEQSILNFSGDCMLREVVLLGNKQAVVFARSIIPITDDTQNLLKIGSKPLGEVLFNDANVYRGKLQITRSGNIWGRRSVFTIGASKLLVSEFFLEVLYA